jgi:hypothetical protein
MNQHGERRTAITYVRVSSAEALVIDGLRWHPRAASGA